MVQRRGRPLKAFTEGSGSSSDSDNDTDAFASISNKKKPRLNSVAVGLGGGGAVDPLTTSSFDAPPTSSSSASINDLPSTVDSSSSSSTKRHHHLNSARQAKMDALLQELQTTQPSDAASAAVHREDAYYGSIHDGDSFYERDGGSNFAPQKKGSYVEPGMEHLTTNLFVGNLDPMTTEEELTDVFRQFGDLYSLKIMWPRTSEERARNRNTGFVCFMHRADAEDAMDALCDADPLGTGRRMVLRWGKNVKKTVKFGTGGVPTNLRKKPRVSLKDTAAADKCDVVDPSSNSSRRDHHLSVDIPKNLDAQSRGENDSHNSSLENKPSLKCNVQKVSPLLGPTYDPAQHAALAIHVKSPADPRREKFISTVASFVAKDGSIFEQKLIETQGLNPDFRFLTLRDDDAASNHIGKFDDESLRFEEHLFYRWRVYSFSQGDGFNSWRTDPFVMFEPHGRFWIPPRLNTMAAQEEEEAERRREQKRQADQEERRKQVEKKIDCIGTGAQLRRSCSEKAGGIKLNEWERKVFHELLREKLCASKESICNAMAFAFDKSGAAKEISELLKAALLETGNGISADTRIARLFLLSDILFNSQQPGVRNAFQYRDAIEAMSPEVFENLGQHGGGRMTKNKLRKAVSSVLGAWTNWSVYNSTFIDELENKFEGRETLNITLNTGEDIDRNDGDEAERTDVEKECISHHEHNEKSISTTPRGTWVSGISVEPCGTSEDFDGKVNDNLDGEEYDNEKVENEVDDIDGEELDVDDVDGEAIDDFDGDELVEDDLL